jgi:hypothetical protein
MTQVCNSRIVEKPLSPCEVLPPQFPIYWASNANSQSGLGYLTVGYHDDSKSADAPASLP